MTERKGQVAEELKYHEARTKVLRLEYQIIQQQLITATQLPLFKEAEHE